MQQDTTPPYTLQTPAEADNILISLKLLKLW